MKRYLTRGNAMGAADVRVLEQLGFARTAVHPGAFRREGRTLDIWDYMRSPGAKKEESL